MHTENDAEFDVEEMKEIIDPCHGETRFLVRPGEGASQPVLDLATFGWLVPSSLTRAG